MLTRLLLYKKGYIRIRVSGASTERFLNACSYRGIGLWRVQAVDHAYEMNLGIREFRRLKPILRKTGVKLRIIQKYGLPFALKNYRKRKAFFIGMAGCVILFFFLSQFIWSIRIQGNQTRSDESILTFLKTRSVETGMKKSKVDCAGIVAQLRKKYDDIIWVSASIDGTVLKIQVKENEDDVKIQSGSSGNAADGQAMDLVANQKAIIQSIVARKGIVNVKPGEKVKKGQILISGEISVRNDSGEVIGYQYQTADADIVGKISVKYEDVHADAYTEKEFQGISKQEYTLQIGKIRLTLGGVKQHDKHFEMTGSRKQLCLLQGLWLPVFVESRTSRPYKPIRKKYTDQKIQKILTERFLRYCEDLGKKGVEILENDVKIYRGSGTFSAKGKLVLLVPLGKRIPTVKSEIPKQRKEKTGDKIDGNDGSDH